LKKIKSLAIICLLFTSLTVPTSALATSGYNYSQQSSFDSFLDSIFSFFFGDNKNHNYDSGNYQTNTYQTNTIKYDGKYYWCWTKFWWGWGWKKYSKKDWEDYIEKHIPKESWDIWKKWYCW
jgi:hypothetical protein